MSGQSDRGGGEIQLHFCQRCGISIPVADVESGRAPPAPGGFLCAGCVYLERDRDWTSAAEGSAAAGPQGGRSDGGARALAAVALLYVVGATTFLLIREMNRKPPEIVLPATLASARDVKALDGALGDLDKQVRAALTDLRGNDGELRTRLLALQQELATATSRAASADEAALERDRQIVAGLLDLTDRTVGLKRGIPEILEELRGLRQRVEAGGTPGGGNENGPPVGVDPGGAEPASLSREEQEKRKKVAEYIGKLTERTSSDQTRYNAAVQLGDLHDPSAIDPLLEALEKDPYDLVRRAAAWSLGMMGKEGSRAVPALIRQIGMKEEYVGYMCERALGEITKAILGAAVSFKYDPTMSQRERKAIQKKWEDWLEQNKHLLPTG